MLTFDFFFLILNLREAIRLNRTGEEKVKISGLQKVTLLDYPGLVACTVFTPGCNFRCPWCHNAGLVIRAGNDTVSEEEFFALLKKRRGLLDGVCVTGGEPTFQSGLLDFIQKMKDLGYLVKLDSNGYSPKILKEIVGSGLVDYVAMDLKNSLEHYPETVGMDPKEFKKENILESVEFLKSGSVDYEFRTTLIRQFHDAKRLKDMVPLLVGSKRYFLQNFKDSGDLVDESRKYEGFSADECEEFQKIFLNAGVPCELRGIE